MINPEIIKAAADLYMDRGMSFKHKKPKLDELIAKLNPQEREAFFGQVYILMNQTIRQVKETK